MNRTYIFRSSTDYATVEVARELAFIQHNGNGHITDAKLVRNVKAIKDLLNKEFKGQEEWRWIA